ncbi:MAG: FG-GAP-like repeat-containing protein, partial [bacterium]
MSKRFKCNIFLTAFWVLLSYIQLNAQNINAPQIIDFYPTRYSTQNNPSVNISVQFDQAMDSSTFLPETFIVYGEHTGYHTGTFTYNSVTQTVTYVPTTPFKEGELVNAILTKEIKGENGVPLLSSFQWSFLIQSLGGSGVFQPDSMYNVESGPQSITIADFDNDRDLDFAVSHSGSNNIQILINDGSGTFQISDTIDVMNTSRSLIASDLNSDGNIDIAAANKSSNSVSFLINQGQGTFLLKENLAVTGTDFNYIITGDFNGDGKLDLATVNRASSDVTILINNDTTFTEVGPFSVGLLPRSGFAGDFNNDGILDIVTANLSDNNFSFLAGNGDGTFASDTTFNVGNSPHFITGGDFNKDRNIDLAVTNRTDNNVSILFNNSDGTFVLNDNLQVGTEPRSVLAKDFDGDFDLDMVVGNYTSNDMSLLLNTGMGNFISDSTYSVGLSPRFINGGDLDGDGDLDLAVAYWGEDHVQILKNMDIVNQPPEAPILILPSNRTFFNASTQPPKLGWLVPTDSDDDSLHFRVEVDVDVNFNSPLQIFESKEDITGFVPAPPVAQGIDSVYFELPTPLQDGLYWWRVSAWDGIVYGAPSAPQSFVIDTSPPNLDSLLLPTPVFPPNWYNQNQISSINFGVQFDEQYAQKAEFNLGLLGGVQLLENIQSGFDQIAEVTINLSDKTDGIYPLTVTVFDSAGNLAQDTSNIALDSTPPVGTEASSPDTSSEESFVVTWGNTATDGNGSGLSGIYDVKVQIDGGAWQDWRTNFTGTFDTFQGTHGQTYGFEAVAHDNVGNIEVFSQIPETVTLVDTTANDVNAPGPPLSLTASGSNPSPWQNNPTFQIAWQAPDDPSGIDKALYKLGEPPVANFDTTGSVTGGSSIEITATQEDGQNFYLWFVDLRGNVDFQNNGVVTLLYDKTPPTGTQANSPAISAEESFLVSWGGTGTDGAGSGLSGIYDVRLQINGGAWTNWKTNFQDTSAVYLGTHGQTYGFEAAAHDNVGNIETFLGIAETETTVDTTANDVTAPGPPLSLTANGSNPSPWQNNPTFQIAWQ